MTVDLYKPVPASELSRTPESALARGLAVVEFDAYYDQAQQLVTEIAEFARQLDGSLPLRDTGSPRRVMPMEDRDVRRMNMYGHRIAGILLPLTGVHVREVIRGRFIAFDNAGDETPSHTDIQLEDDHELTVGMDLVGDGVLKTWSYTHTSGIGITTRTPVLLRPGTTIVQRNRTPVEHEVQSQSAGRYVGIWDLAA
ncbi:hypothetical protein KC957_03610 [Candidatus Saccharibacteria bacterium]|nr:hypothetical protein [Candidatus Saccharibacteria bacterium]